LIFKNKKKLKEIEYNIGDYVLLNNMKLDLNYDKSDYKKSLKAKIIDSQLVYSGIRYQMLVENDNIWWLNSSFILRKMTSEEIEKFEIKINTKKYNI